MGADNPQPTHQLGLDIFFGRNGRTRDVEAGLDLVRQAANAGSVDSQYFLGGIFEQGLGGVRADQAEAADWFRVACGQRHAPSQFRLARMLLEGRTGVAQDLPAGARLLRQAAMQDHVAAMSRLGECLADGIGVTRRDEDAARWFRKAADAGDAAAQVNLGYFYRQGRGGLPESASDALEWYLRAADAGNADGQFNAGYLYDANLVPGGEEAAVKLYEKAAKQKHASAAFNLANILFRSESFPAAVRWLRVAADGGRTDAKTNLAHILAEGYEGVPANPAEAAALYAELADNDGGAALQLGLMLLHGNGVAADPAAGLARLRAAAEDGYVDAMWELARCLQPQAGIIDASLTDADEAQSWCAKAAESGEVCAMAALACAYESAPTPNYELVALWYARAANTAFDEEEMDEAAAKAIAASQANMARLAFVGVPSVMQSYADALSWARKAVDTHIRDGNALWLLSFMHRRGLGTAKDADIADVYAAKAAAASAPDADFGGALRKMSQLLNSDVAKELVSLL